VACYFERGDEPLDSMKVYCLFEGLLAVQEEARSVQVAWLFGYLVCGLVRCCDHFGPQQLTTQLALPLYFIFFPRIN
jgi:hypothetical protein